MPRYATWLKLPGGGRAIVCTSRPAKACATCQGRLAAYLCDFPIAPGKTCDKPLCNECRVHLSVDKCTSAVDYCPDHAGSDSELQSRMGLPETPYPSSGGA